MTTAARVLTAHTPHEGTGPSSPWAYQPGRVLHGFQLQQQHPATQQQQPRGSTALTPQRASCVSRSLLSARLLSRRGGEAPQPMHEECSEASDDDGCFLDDHEGETESWSWMPAEEGGSVQESDRSSLATASSQPIAIPARLVGRRGSLGWFRQRGPCPRTQHTTCLPTWEGPVCVCV
jgi:hypothetical protein